jgi:CubicO group peptidase (beta-lactamase class C family)
MTRSGSGPGGADSTAAATGVGEVLRPLAERVTEAMARLRVPGVAVGLLLDGAEHTAGFGVTNVDHPLPVDADTLFQVGSTTKTATATLAVQLAEAGALDLDAPVRAYLPELRLADEAVAAAVTLGHLLTHTGGWAGDYFPDTGEGDDALARAVAGLAEAPQLTPLGALWSYNNAGFYLAGRVLEVVTGRPYEALVRERLLQPLGMDRSCFGADEAITHRVAAGHQVGDGPPAVARPWALARAAAPAGGLVSTARDQLRYARFHLGDGTASGPGGARLLSAAALAGMRAPRVPRDNAGGTMGLTWFLQDLAAAGGGPGARRVAHGGATRGQLSAFLLVPELGFALTVLTNANRGGQLLTEVTKWAQRHYLGLAEPEPEPLALSEAELAPYAGRYAGALVTADAELRVRDGGLVLQVVPKGGFPKPGTPPPPAPPPVRAAVCAGDGLVALEPPLQDARGDFLRGPDGRIAWLRFGARLLARQG